MLYRTYAAMLLVQVDTLVGGNLIEKIYHAGGQGHEADIYSRAPDTGYAPGGGIIYDTLLLLCVLPQDQERGQKKTTGQQSLSCVMTGGGGAGKK